MRPSVFAEKNLMINSNIPFSFKGREYFIPIYDSADRVELFRTGRQCGKTTFLANRIITRALSIPSIQILYEAPRKEQSSMFSYQKLRPILEFSPRIRPWLKLTSTGEITDIAVEKMRCFKSGAFVKLSSTFNGADRDRGMSINDLYIDEVQDQYKEDIEVLAEGLSASIIPPYMVYAGTPKTESNFIEQLWKDSKQIMWYVRCDRCNTWQVPGEIDIEKSFQEKGLLCYKCEKPLNMLNGRWVARRPVAKFNGWHIPQTMRLVPKMPGSLPWKDEFGQHGIFDKYKNYEPKRFYNEVLGFPYDTADKPLALHDIKNASYTNIHKQEKWDERYFMIPVVMGIDWGRNNKNHTVVSISSFYNDMPVLLYMRKFSGAEADPEKTARIILEIYKKFNCTTAFCDNGMYYHYQYEMAKAFGNDFIDKNFNFVQYGGWRKELVIKVRGNRDRKLLWIVSRNDLLQLFVQHIKQRKLGFYNFQEFVNENFHNDYLAMGYEVRETKDRGETLFFQNSKDAEAPTDCFHSHFYSWFGLNVSVTGRLKFYISDDKNI